MKTGNGLWAIPVVLSLTLAFSALLVSAEDPWAFGSAIVTGLAYLVAIIAAIVWFVESKNRKRSAVAFLLGTVVLLGVVYAVSGFNGYPATNYSETTITKCTTPSSCGGYDVPVQDVLGGFTSNVFVWAPPVGLFLFIVASLEASLPRYYRFARFLGGCVIAAAILISVVGIQFSGSLQVLPSIHMPLNPFLATGECDSMTSIGGCVYVDRLYVLADYVFWLAVAILASTTANAFITTPGGRGKGGVVLSTLLVLALTVGLVVIPVSIAQSGVLVNSGNSFSFYPDNSFVRVPFVAGSNETLFGDFSSNAGVRAYVLTTPQFESLNQNGTLCPSSSISPLIATATQGFINTKVGPGSYSLLFCSTLTNVPSIHVSISSPIRLSHS